VVRSLFLISAALLFLVFFLVTPVAIVFYEAFRQGWAVYKAAIFDPDALAAIKLTLLTAAIAVPLNLVFGVAAAWAIAKFPPSWIIGGTKNWKSSTVTRFTCFRDTFAFSSMKTKPAVLIEYSNRVLLNLFLKRT